MRRFAGDQADLMKLLGCLPTAQMPGRISYWSPRWGHVNLTRLDAVCIEREIKQTEDLIGPLGVLSAPPASIARPGVVSAARAIVRMPRSRRSSVPTVSNNLPAGHRCKQASD